MSETLLGSDNPAPQGDGASPQNPTETKAAEATANPTQEAAKADPTPEAKTAPTANTDWSTGFEGEDLGWLQNRGIAGLGIDEAFKKVFETARNAEKRLGVPSDQLLRLPADPTSEGAMDPVWNALGRPEEAGGYELEAGDSEVSQAFTGLLSETFHKAGLTKDQASAVYSAMENFFLSEQEKETTAITDARALGLADLKKEWGDDLFDFNVNLAREAVKAVGATKEEIDALTEAFGENGDARVIRLFNRIGQKRGQEDGFVTGDAGIAGLGATTPEAAKQRIEELKADPEWRTKFRQQQHNPDSELMKNYRQLTALAARSRG